MESTPSSNETFSLEAYLARICCDEELDTSLKTLSSLHKRHVAEIPFENLDVLLGKPISIDSTDIFRKMVLERRGGYCFEQNNLLRMALERIGFKVTPMIARVRWQVPPEVTTPLSHMVLKVEADDGVFLADVGFGGTGLVEPIAFEPGMVQHETYEPRRLLKSGSLYSHQVRVNDEWQDAYQFEDKLAPRIDQEVGNWYSCTHPNARFLHDLVAANAGEGERIALLNTKLTVRPYNGEATTREISSYPELLALLEERFGLSFPSETRFRCPNLGLTD